MRPDDFSILHESGPCLVVAKPGAVLTQAAIGIDSLEVRVKRFLKIRDAKPGRVYLGVPHRLDRPVSGAMVLAKNARAARRLSEQFEGRTIKKTYWAVVQGRVTPEQGTWEDYVRKIPGEARAEVVAHDHPEARRAVLHYRAIAKCGMGTWLEITLETGRTHQIRLQAASRGFAVIGDEQYGAGVPFGPEAADPRERVIALHARSLGFYHPTTHEPVNVVAKVPSYWKPLGLKGVRYAGEPFPDECTKP